MAGAVIAAATSVHQKLGNGKMPRLYKDAISWEFEQQKIAFLRDIEIPDPSMYGVISCMPRVDFLCYNSLFVELITAARISAEHRLAAMRRLQNSTVQRALLICLGSEVLYYEKLFR